MKADMHIHTTFSFDGGSTMEEYCKEAIAQKIDIICFTEHVDFNDMENDRFKYDYKGYFKELCRLREIYKNLTILSGMEFSEPHLFPEQFKKLSELPYDNIIGSIHHCKNSLFPAPKNLTEEQAVKEYYELMLETVSKCNFQTLAHLDFPKRYFDEWKYDINVIEKILKTIIQKNIVLEVNTSTLNGEGTQPMPSISVLELYLKLGGTKVVLSSDAHVTKFLGKSFEEALKIIPKDLKVGYFKNRKFIEIERKKYKKIEETINSNDNNKNL